MALDIVKITAALNAYPWMRGAYSMRDSGAAMYCAVGLLLRYAGVAQAEIECAGAPHMWGRYRELLESEYGITELATIINIIQANDSAASHEEAIEQVQFVLAGGDIGRRLRDCQVAADVLAETARQSIEDDGNACGALVG